MPRRRKTTNPAAQQHATKPTTTKETIKSQSNNPSQSQSMTSTSNQPNQPSKSNAEINVTSREFDLGVEFAADPQKPAEADNQYLECISKQLNHDLPHRPLVPICKGVDGTAHVERVALKRGFAGQKNHYLITLTIFMSQPVTVNMATQERLLKDLYGRLFESLRPEIAGQLTTADDEMVAIILQSEDTIKVTPTQASERIRQRNKYEVDVFVRTVECLDHCRAEWGVFLHNLNRCIVPALQVVSVLDATGQPATHARLSNYQRNLMFTFRFARPYARPDANWLRVLSGFCYPLVCHARFAQMQAEPTNDSHRKAFEAIDNYSKLKMASLSAY